MEKEQLTRIITWMNLENITLREKSLTQKGKYDMVYFYEILEETKLTYNVKISSVVAWVRDAGT